MVERNFLLFFIVFVLLLCILVVPSSAWLTDYGFRQSNLLNGSNDGALTNYQIPFTINTSTGTSSGQTCYLNGHNLAEWNDIRFTDGSDNLLPYWMETNTNTTTSATFWVNVSSIPFGSLNQTTVNVYYGKSGDVGASNLTNTSLFGDDFSTGSLDTGKWTDVKGSGTSVSGGILTVLAADASVYGVSSNSNLGTGISVRTRAKPYHPGNVAYLEAIQMRYGDDNHQDSVYYSHVSSPYNQKYYITNDGTHITVSSMPGMSGSAWYVQEAKMNSSSVTWTLNNANAVSQSSYYYTTSGKARVVTYAANSKVDIDWIFSRKYTTNEPTHSAWGAEESFLYPVSFTQNVTIGVPSFAVQFTDTSTGSPVSWNWSFGDGTANSTSQNPSHVFTTTGVFYVSLTAMNDDGNSGTYTIPIYSQGTLSGYGNRQRYNVTGNSGWSAPSNNSYEYYLDVYNLNGVSENQTVYLNGHAANFPNDIIFTDGDGISLENFWIQTDLINATYARFWVNASLSSNITPQFIYYGNASQVVSNSNITKTMPFGDDFQGQVWNRTGLVFTYNDQAWEGDTGGAITILNESDPFILTGNATVLKQWYQAGVTQATQGMGYAESADGGTTWYKYSGNPVVSMSPNSAQGGTVVHKGSTYYMFVSKNYADIELWKSSNGVTGWAYVATIITPNHVWDSEKTLYCSVYVDGDNWYMLFGGDNSSHHWGIGLATCVSSGDPTDWTEYAGNPVIYDSTGLIIATAAPIFVDSDGNYWYWPAGGDSPAEDTSGAQPRRYFSSDMITWTRDPVTYPIVSSGLEGEGVPTQQMGIYGIIPTSYGTDIFVDYYGGSGAPYTGASMTRMTSNLTLEQIVHTDENAIDVSKWSSSGTVTFINKYNGTLNVSGSSTIDGSLSVPKNFTMTLIANISPTSGNMYAGFINGGATKYWYFSRHLDTYNDVNVTLSYHDIGNSYTGMRQWDITKDGSNNLIIYDVNGTQVNSYTSTDSSQQFVRIQSSTVNNRISVDSVFIHHFLSPSPLYDSWGDEETFATSPVTSFTSNVTSGYPPFLVQFNDTSTNMPTNWSWYFGDGHTSTDQNATNWYNVTIGNTITAYEVDLNASNSAGNDWSNQSGYITAYPLNASFTANVTSGVWPLAVSFTDATGNGTATAWNWSFGDGNFSNSQNPVYTFASTGVFNVTLNASNSYSWDNVTRGITVLDSLSPPVANFYANATSGQSPLVVQFTDTSSNTPTSWNWSFGDGNYSSDQNPVHIFWDVGGYNITLIAANEAGNGSTTKNNYIVVLSPGENVFNINETHGSTWIRWMWDIPDSHIGDGKFLVVFVDGSEVLNMTLNTSADKIETYEISKKMIGKEVKGNERHVIDLIEYSSSSDGVYMSDRETLTTTTDQPDILNYVVFGVAVALLVISIIVASRELSAILLVVSLIMSLYLAISSLKPNFSFALVSLIVAVSGGFLLIYRVMEYVKNIYGDD